MDLAEATADDFLNLIDQSFEIDGEGLAPLTLAEVESKGTRLESGRTPFSLLFRADTDTLMPQQIYRLQHKATGPIEIFLVPVAQGADHVLYEAMFA